LFDVFPALSLADDVDDDGVSADYLLLFYDELGFVVDPSDVLII